MSVQRWQPSDKGGFCDMHDKGNYVLYDAHTKLETEVDQLRRENATLVNWLRRIRLEMGRPEELAILVARGGA